VQAENETFDFELGFSFPLFTDVNGTLRTDIAYPFNIYGFHLETTLPSSSDFTILGSNLFLGSGGSNPFFIGPTIPENVNSFCILAFSFVMLAFLHKKHCT
jgi:hypothetical protein